MQMMTGTINTDEAPAHRWLRRLYAVVLALVGLALLTGGVELVAYGGSFYYLIAGLAVGSSGILIWRNDRRGAWLYGAMLAGTLAWSIWEAGVEPWGLVVRLAAPLVLGVPLLLRSTQPSRPRIATPAGLRQWS